MQQPKEFYRLGSMFLDLTGEQHLNLRRPPAERHSPFEGFIIIMDHAIGFLKTDQERQRVIDYLDYLLDSGLSEAQLSAIWQRTGARDAMTPTDTFFRMIRDRIASTLTRP